MRNRKSIFSLLLVAVMVVTLFASAVPAEAADDTLTVINNLSPTTLDPFGSSDNNKPVLHQIFDTLTVFGEDGSLEPCLALEWVESDDGHFFTYTLRQGVKFHDGSDFNADCVVYSVNAMLNSDNMSWGSSYIEKAEKVDDYTVNIFKGSSFAALNNFMTEYLYIVSPSAYEAEDRATNPVGTGAYSFVEWAADDSIVMAANEDYFMGKPGFANLVVRPPLDSSTALIALQNNEADIVVHMDLSQYETICYDDSVTPLIADAWGCQMIMMMGDDYRYDMNLRKAVYYGVNRENAAIFSNQPKGYVPCRSMFAEKLMGDYAGCMDIGDYDVELAKSYLEKSDYDGRVLPIVAREVDLNIAQSVQEDLAALGIESAIQQVDNNTYDDWYCTGVSGMYFGEYGCDYATVEDTINYTCAQGFYGPFVYTNEELDNLMLEAADIWVEADREELVKQALYLTWDYADMVPVYESQFMSAYRTGLTGIPEISAANWLFYFYKVQASA